MLCPKCNHAELEIRESQAVKTLCCHEWQPSKSDGEWINKGSCDFRIPFKNKVFGTLSLEDIKELMRGNQIKNNKGDIMELDLESEYFTKITFAEAKVEKFDI